MDLKKLNGYLSAAKKNPTAVSGQENQTSSRNPTGLETPTGKNSEREKPRENVIKKSKSFSKPITVSVNLERGNKNSSNPITPQGVKRSDVEEQQKYHESQSEEKEVNIFPAEETEGK